VIFLEGMCELLHTQGDKPKARLLAALIKGAPLPRHEHHGHSAADGRDPSIVKAGKISSRRHLAYSDLVRQNVLTRPRPLSAPVFVM
jgi:hypothetical protein